MQMNIGMITLISFILIFLVIIYRKKINEWLLSEIILRRIVKFTTRIHVISSTLASDTDIGWSRILVLMRWYARVNGYMTDINNLYEIISRKLLEDIDAARKSGSPANRELSAYYTFEHWMTTMRKYISRKNFQVDVRQIIKVINIALKDGNQWRDGG